MALRFMYPRVEAQSIIHRAAELLLAPEVAFGRLDGHVAEQKLNLVEFAAG
jgi:hypothetical protein